MALSLDHPRICRIYRIIFTWKAAGLGFLAAASLSACASTSGQAVARAQSAKDARSLASNIESQSTTILGEEERDHRRAGTSRAEPRPPVDLTPALTVADEVFNQALLGAGERVAGWWRPLMSQPDYQTLLDPQRTFEGSISLGSVANGKLLNAARLEVEGNYHSVIERHRSRNTQFATEAMVTLIQDSARAVLEESPGPKLRIGNMSAHGGGKIVWSRSHHSGRDADLAFFCRDDKLDRAVPAPDLLRFDENGRAISQPNLVFDTSRNWLLVKALLNHPTVGIQWIFVSNPLKEMLLEHAEELGEDPALLARAAEVLHQPTDAAPHNDHFHLRITCPMADRLEGCLDFGPRWQWVDWHDEALKARSIAIAGAFDSPDDSLRLKALEYLEKIRSPFAPALALMAARRETNPELRRRALKLAADIPTESAAAIVEALQLVRDGAFSLGEKHFGYKILRRSADPLALEPLKARVNDLTLSTEERLLAADALGHYMESALVPFLLEQLRVQPPEVSAELAKLLRRVTNHSENFDWKKLPADTDTDEARAQILSQWEDWWEENQARPRQDWLKNGFSAYGLPPQKQGLDAFDPQDARDDAHSDKPLDKSTVDALISMLDKTPEHIAYNANRELIRITGRWAPLEAWDYPRLHTYWARWWKWTLANEPIPLALLNN